MYRPTLDTRDKSGALLGVAAVHALLLLMLLQLSGRVDFTDPESVTRVFDVTEAPPPPEEPVVEPRTEAGRPEEAEGAASERNIRSEATPVVAPRREISLPVPVPMETSETPLEGTEATQGASDVIGPGTGAGGVGTGTGSGGSGSGTGGGGSGGYVTPPQLLTPPLRGRDFPRQMLDDWPRGAQIFMRVRVSATGGVSQCIVDRGTGNARLDSAICAIVQQRFRYRPALNAARQPVAGWAGYRQLPPR